MAEMTGKVDGCKNETQYIQDSLNALNDRLEAYLERIKGDVDKMAERNLKLFNKFTDTAKQTEAKYEEFNRKMDAQTSFFESLK